jgi:predicted glycogen debranching enzyme
VTNVIAFDKTICGLEAALSRGWLENRGLLGFSCGTVAGANTRRYHGLLTAALKPPGGRMLLLSKIEETLVVNDLQIDLSTNEYQGAVHSRGYSHLATFCINPFPTFTFEVEGLKVKKSVFMVCGSNTVQVEYKLLDCPAGAQPQLELRPLIAFRDYHSTTHAINALNPAVESAPDLASVQPYPGLPRLYFAHNAQTVQEEGYWYRNFIYRVECESGLDFQEDLFNPPDRKPSSETSLRLVYATTWKFQQLR